MKISGIPSTSAHRSELKYYNVGTRNTRKTSEKGVSLRMMRLQHKFFLRSYPFKTKQFFKTDWPPSIRPFNAIAYQRESKSLMQELPHIKGDFHAMDPHPLLPWKTEFDVSYTKPSQSLLQLQQTIDMQSQYQQWHLQTKTCLVGSSSDQMAS